MTEQQSLSLSEAVTTFLATLSPEQKQESQQELNRFVRWYGAERPITGLIAREIGNYGDNVSSFVANPAKKLEPVRSFLAYAKKKKLIEISLAPHLRVSKGKQSRSVRKGSIDNTTPLTSEGYATLESELDVLKKERPRIAEQLRLAAADKDLRENAPLETAKEHQGQIEARIREIEATLKSSTIIKKKPKGTKTVGVGCTVSLRDLGSGEQLRYILVSPSEANPTKGKLSIASPTGKALLDNEIGAVIEVIAPVGTLRYQIDEIKG
ncbi:MAG: transcription elongation factor GreA [Dehalococcoidia bacterium]|nr:transcription elongation factor GreA [Dehalococcoidia bacterium]